MIFQRNQKGFALAFAVLLVVVLQATIANIIFSMMRHQREIARVSHRTQVAWAREAVIDRAIKLFVDCVQEKKGFPGTDLNQFVLCDVGMAACGFPASPLPFSQYLTDSWYPGFRSRFSDLLNLIQLSSIVIKDLTGSGNPRQYDIQVTAQHSITQVRMEATQRITITIITPGPDPPFSYSIVRGQWNEGPSL